METRMPGGLLYFLVLLLLGALVLGVFLTPADHKAGINEYSRAKFLEMVEGRAHRPYVYRTLLPTAVNLAAELAPDRFHRYSADLAERSRWVGKVFSTLGWETRAAGRYLLASLFMYLGFVGFGHYTVKLTRQLCPVPETGRADLLLVMAALLGLPPFFRYCAYLYDPAQLFLFTLALYLLATKSLRIFWPVFVLCCLNKETAVLLIPLYALAAGDRSAPVGRNRGPLAGLAAVFLGIKTALAVAFKDNPGTFMEFHLGHNLRWLAGGWGFGDLLVLVALAFLISYRWQEKPAFLRRSFLWVLLPLVSLALFLGYADEWRGYLEAYPLAFGLIVHSIMRLGGPASGRGSGAA